MRKVKIITDSCADLSAEQLEKYDMIDGYELDFMRFIVLFKSGEGKEKAPLRDDPWRKAYHDSAGFR